MEHEPERLPERQQPPRSPIPQDLARLAESRRALDRRSEAPEGEDGSGSSGQLVRASRPGPQAGRPGSTGGRLPAARRPQPSGPRSDPTTTTLVVPAEDEDADPRPGAPGDFPTDEVAGRHRGGSRVPRGLLVTVGVVVVAGVGLAVAGVFDGGPSPSGTAVAHAGAPASGAADAEAPTPTGLADPNATGSPGATDASTAPTPSRSRTPTRGRPTPAVAGSPTGAGNATQPGSPGRSTPGTSGSSTAPNPTPTTPASSPSSSGGQALSKGMTGPAVSEMQHLLDQDQYLWWYTDGTFDQNTYDAVRNFQIDHPGTAAADGRGVYGAATRAALRADLGLGP
jgi:hypothetical protein